MIWAYTWGLPLVHKRVSKSLFQNLIKKVRARAQSWQTNRISLAGRITLSKFVLSSLSTYMMQAIPTPKGTCEQHDRISRNFIWGISYANPRKDVDRASDK